MEIQLPEDHPLARAIRNWDGTRSTWLLLKENGGESSFRAYLKGWSMTGNTMTAEFESWEDYCEYQARGMGL